MATELLKKLNHTLIALLIQFSLGFLFNQWLMGAMVATALFLGREHAQAEYRWIEKYGAGKRENLSFWDTFDSRVWDTDSFFWDLLLPVITTILVSLGFILQ